MTIDEELFEARATDLYAVWPVYRKYKPRMKRNSLINLLKSNNFAIGIAILSVLVQSFHSFTAFYNVSSLKGTAWGIAQAILFAVIIDLAILFYTVRKNVRVTWMAGFVMVLINCYYYYSHLGLSFDLILGGLLSLIIPVSVYYYSEEIHDEPESIKALDEQVHPMDNGPADTSLVSVQKSVPRTDRPVR